MAETKYTTQEGDTWAMIAYKAYGDVNKFPQIMAANPNVSWDDELPGNIDIFVPIQEANTQQNSLTPPWKRK